jgi:hypothetical protein
MQSGVGLGVDVSHDQPFKAFHVGRQRNALYSDVENAYFLDVENV